MERDLAFPWTLELLASHVSVDPSYLSRLFGRQVYRSPMAFLASRRVDRAALQLIQTNRPIQLIGASVGWPDPAHFSRTFRRLYGMSPSDFRRASRA